MLFGFIPAFLTFSLTKDWWLLAYLGAFIWFGITGFRNIIQSVLGGGGLRRSPLLPWNSLVSWSRISDSLLYTGFSVPLLDFLVKTLLLERTFGITTSTNAIVLYAVMGLANGIYISSHNIFRGLPRAAATGNFFRSILAIPLAVLLNSIIGLTLQVSGVPDVAGGLQKWAAVISKFASDCVAAVIEGLADRQTNIRARLVAYQAKISQLFSVFSRMELLFPEEDVLEMLQSPKMIMETLNYEARDQEKRIIVNALDLMYFWMYPATGRAGTGDHLRRNDQGGMADFLSLATGAETLPGDQPGFCRRFGRAEFFQGPVLLSGPVRGISERSGKTRQKETMRRAIKKLPQFPKALFLLLDFASSGHNVIGT